MALIEYIGKKEQKTDNVAGTGTVWNGAGDVQEVESSAAVEKLIAHKDVWRVVKGKAGAAPATPAKDKKAAEPVKRKQEPEETDEPSVRLDVSTMNKSTLIANAKRHFNADLDATKTLPKLREEMAKLIAKDGTVSRNVRKA